MPEILTGDNLPHLLKMPSDSLDAVITDPPYGLSQINQKDVLDCLTAWMKGEVFKPSKKGFMGESWDAFVPGPEVWKELYRVLKPGGHILVFSATRNADLMGIALRLGGFEARDTIHWTYSHGVPKSLDVTKFIDGMDAIGSKRERALTVAKWLRSTGALTAEKIDAITGTSMGSHFLTLQGQLRLPTPEMFNLLRPYLPEVPEEVESIIHSRKVESENLNKRETVAIETKGLTSKHNGKEKAYGFKPTFKRTAPHTEDAKKWTGWGTSLKPSHEIILVYRKPIPKGSTVAENILTYGTGGLNIDACRVPTNDKLVIAKSKGHRTGVYASSNPSEKVTKPGQLLGRFPSNTILTHDPQCGYEEALFESQDRQWICFEGCPCKSLDDQSSHPPFEDTKGASKFYSRLNYDPILYFPKPTGKEREAGLEIQEGEARGNTHPTVKPIALMRHLCRLVTPPGGRVLDPFAGSGTTGIAALLEGFEVTLIEKEAKYVSIIEDRIAHYINK